MFYRVEFEGGKEETPHCVRGDSGDGGDSSQIWLGVTWGWCLLFRCFKITTFIVNCNSKPLKGGESNGD
jgi:hypothetical protein